MTYLKENIRAELSQSSTFPTRSTTLKTVDAFTYSVVYSDLSDGTYYLRVKALNSTGLTDPSEFVTVYLNNTSSVPDINALEFCYAYYDFAGNCHIVINNAESSSVSIALYSVTGILIDSFTYSLSSGKNVLSPDLTRYIKGFYMMRVRVGSKEKTLKIRH